MVKRSKGFRVGTRKKLAKRVWERGRIHIKRSLQEFEVGDQVIIKVDPAYHKGMPHSRHFGKQGEVIEKRGRAYVVKLRSGNLYKKLICAPVHLKKA
jgi:large subunit ribosomal protein L21e